MANVYAIGEIVYDIIFRNNQPQQANPGGSMLNSAISLSRAQNQVFFIGETGSDEVGNIIKSFLIDNSVNISFIQSYSNRKSSIALAFLNEQNDASYSFYKDFPAQRFTLDLPIPQQGDIVLFGSSFALQSEVRNPLLHLLHNAKQNGATIIYDPNFRKQLHDKSELLLLVKENISMADIVRGSDEDFKNIFGITNDSELYAKVKEYGCNYLIVTKNANGIKLLTPTFETTVSVPQITTISTIGAGDNFNAGLIHGLLEQGITKDALTEISNEQWSVIIETGKEFATHVCQSLDNYVSKEFAEKYTIRK